MGTTQSQELKPKQQSIDFSNILQQNQQQTNINERLTQAIHNTLYAERLRSSKSLQQLKIEQQQQFKLLVNCKLQNKQMIKKNHKESENILSGILYKQSANILSPWQKRYSAVGQHCFMYKQTESNNSNTAGFLNFSLLAAKLVVYKPQNPEYFQIQIEGCDKKFVFRGSDSKQTKLWSDKLKNIIEQSLGKKYKLTYLSHYHRFWRKQYFSEKQFRQSSEIGDLILFRGNKNSSVLQRAITFDQYDHIALILKNAYDQILLFEANYGTGVGIMTWRSFIKHQHYKMQDLVVFRKLNIKKNPKFFQIIESFVSNNLGKSYKFSVGKVIGNRISQPENKKDFFCSSLIASVYKKLEILQPDISSNKYMPSNFSSNYGMKLKCDGQFGNAFLQPQKIIVFEQKFFQTE